MANIEDFDDILDHVGGWGRFQYQITVVNLLFNMFLGYVYYSPILTVFTPPHWCAVPQLGNLSQDLRREISIPRDENVRGDFIIIKPVVVLSHIGNSQGCLQSVSF